MNRHGTSQALAAGTMLDEYRIERLLGQGNFGFTYLAFDTMLERHVAIKEYFPEDLARRDGLRVALKDEEKRDIYQFGRDAFMSEARLLAKLKHPHIVHVARYFSAHETVYFVMDYEEGETLAQRLQRQGRPLTTAEARTLLEQLLSALSAVHEKKYLHRDIKPANILLRRNGEAVLIDFGAAKMEFGAAGSLGHMALTPGYAPIEQYYQDAEQGPWSDLYALGATFYRALTLERPPDSLTRQKAVAQGLPDPLTPLVARASAEHPKEFLALIDSMLALDASKRPKDAAQLLVQLRAAPGAPLLKAHEKSFSYRPRKLAREHKILFVGPVGAGKTTAISVLSDKGCISTDQAASDMTKALKNKTTVAMDYGVMDLGDGERVHLYGAPGQERFDFMWEILQKGALGLVILIDNSRRAPLDDLAFYLRWFSDLLKKSKMVVGVNFMEKSAAPGLDDYARVIRECGFSAPPAVFEVDARNRRDMAMLIEALLVSIDPGVQDA
ncbi:MAG: serine/threonine-protein kinase [Rhodocyclaceae bacterium]|nr:serine/threonine-protein kinase [Rhodocyclaceae bacterium]